MWVREKGNQHTRTVTTKIGNLSEPTCALRLHCDTIVRKPPHDRADDHLRMAHRQVVAPTFYRDQLRPRDQRLDAGRVFVLHRLVCRALCVFHGSGGNG
jgi:hypothetical protein